MSLLGFLLLVPIAIGKETFTPSLALSANQFTAVFNYVPLTVTSNTDHFNLQKDSVHGAIERVTFPDLAHISISYGCQE
jgi:hypothetical protein